MLIDAADIHVENAKHIRSSTWAWKNIELGNAAIDLLRAAALLPLEDKDSTTVLRLGIRLINSAGAAGICAMNGYYQPAASHIRDIIEIGFLLDLFRRDRDHISRWRGADDEVRWKHYRPERLRRKLNHMDGSQKTYRNDAYRFYSEHGTHPNPMAVQLISIGNLTQVGPFPDGVRIDALSFDLCRYLAGATLYLSRCIDGHKLEEIDPPSRDYLLKAIAFMDEIDKLRSRTDSPIAVDKSSGPERT